MAIKAAVILSGCGHMDGAEVRESVLVLTELDKQGVLVSCFAPDIDQKEVINHKTGEKTSEVRNVLIESARIARGSVECTSKLQANEYDMLLIPGGLGVAKNLSDLFSPNKIAVLPDIVRIIKEFHSAKKPIGAVCISPALVVAVLGYVEVTIGDDSSGLVKKLGGKHVVCKTREHHFDKQNNIYSCSAYMRNDSLYNVYLGISDMIDSIMMSFNK